ncbi:hypothetical protein J5893_04345 [bacterium]|nr:hypothetical protein [bacterium]
MTTNYNEIKHTYDEISLNIIAPEVKMQETIELPSLADITLKGSVSSETFFGPGKYELLPEQKEKLQ